MSTILVLQALLDQLANLIKGTLHDLEWESKADCVTEETWTHVNNLINEEMIKETQQWPPLLELHGAIDSINTHPGPSSTWEPQGPHPPRSLNGLAHQLWPSLKWYSVPSRLNRVKSRWVMRGPLK
ncbi:hypothetical protein BDN67DRAFT_984042 [Paxillus ammoniavirescens]|nr:hypothetical protein BDN67DRAFT_984042 [Paxillus ammoniavirescens]